ncbi:MAG: CDP-diacylglycerol--glycerol-3-phosphate 3-phosphatidyltransferase [Deltaproteobacteria bacterium CG_4_8_14_3_um_filter_51_11]|nr:CDP-diacylglycerol--glycerol-3-phosphate 3-phosphatidyltransferase [bacterium]OIP37898.1 MAG: CDP-diacylglycerol--glycerol-3-phosphate 3-phosphatidyltransferase [Desulfobacteraceae bacterium CG2_30_51_40]PIP48006.1 MAG: CDP-diacylglycerol--glycerol-3-phosphate 3-phosphatidyltransferase [Deltaproteobacteria bacterium CG23_combo_of_CG06-09_8_20_14_all_51_20]PIX18647.1 MAG: CDP-diacylglycerol--glycerol-3-phosphate 3-phosphatidyltransferase [Deltaproteobacteria bacterium CG_4_8_14_3_um_filter_51_
MNGTDFNIPNGITALRVILLPLFVYLIFQHSQANRIAAFVIFSLASLTDLVDGYLARRLNQETNLGKFLDPLADKFLVLGAFITFIFLSDQIPIWMVLCILARDIFITLLRHLSQYQGAVLRTSRLAKVKTAFQMFSIIIILMSFMVLNVKERALINLNYQDAILSGAGRWNVAFNNLTAFLQGEGGDLIFSLSSFLPYYLMLLTTFITLLSLARYLFTNYKIFTGPIPIIRPKKTSLKHP